MLFLRADYKVFYFISWKYCTSVENSYVCVHLHVCIFVCIYTNIFLYMHIYIKLYFYNILCENTDRLKYSVLTMFFVIICLHIQLSRQTNLLKKKRIHVYITLHFCATSYPILSVSCWLLKNFFINEILIFFLFLYLKLHLFYK